LRLLGRGATFRTALSDFLALPPSAWVRQVAGPVLARLRFVGLAAHWTDEEGSDAMGDPGRQMMSDEETAALLAAAEQLYQKAEQRTREQGLTQGREQGLTQGREQGLTQGREQGLTQGREQGLTQGREQVLARQLSRRLGRPLGEAETATLHARLSTLGAERLSDVVLELEGDALAAWLADPHASLPRSLATSNQSLRNATWSTTPYERPRARSTELEQHFDGIVGR
jgi:hypothetical protein